MWLPKCLIFAKRAFVYAKLAECKRTAMPEAELFKAIATVHSSRISVVLYNMIVYHSLNKYLKQTKIATHVSSRLQTAQMWT